MTDSTSHEGAEESRAVKVGVLLDQEPDEIGEWLADMAAFDAAGADALWVDSGPEPEWDVLALTAALAVVTFRLRLVLALPDSRAPSAGLARTLDTIGRLSHGRLALVADSSRCEELAVVAPRVGIFRRLPGEPGIFEGPGEEDEVERWESGPAPQGRESWRAACADAAGRGARGLVVPADPQLLDILRNPDDLGDRRDLQIAQG